MNKPILALALLTACVSFANVAPNSPTPVPPVAAVDDSLAKERDDLKRQVAELSQASQVLKQQRDQMATNLLDTQALLQLKTNELTQAQARANDLQLKLDAEKAKVEALMKAKTEQQ